MPIRIVTARHGAYSIHTFSGSAHGLAANAHLLCGAHDSVLIDALFLPAEATDLARRIGDMGPPLRHLLITHGHPDHYYGAEAILKLHPAARCVATPEVIADISATFAAKRAFWLPYYPTELPEAPIVPQALDELSLPVDRARLTIHSVGPAEGLHDTVAWFAPASALFVGDLAYNREHAWLGERQVPAWLAAIAACRGQFAAAKHLYPGHGAPAGPELFDQTARYLGVFTEAFAAGGDAGVIAARILGEFPDYGVEEFVHLSLAKWLA